MQRNKKENTFQTLYNQLTINNLITKPKTIKLIQKNIEENPIDLGEDLLI